MRITQEQKANTYIQNAFEYPGFFTRKTPVKVLRIWVYPSFEPFVSFSVANFHEGCFVRRIIWDHRNSFPSEEPQTYCAEQEISVETFEAMLKSLALIEVSPFASRSALGIDGVTFGINFKHYMSESSLSWWGCWPESWHELRNWHAENILKLNQVFSGSPISLEKALTSR